jgi:dihydrofolate reductase
MEAIYATDIKNGLSKNGGIPWKSKKDMTFFMNKTKNNIVIMGKNTYFSLPDNARPLKNRLNIVLTRTPEKYLDYKEGTIFTNNNDNNIIHFILKYKENYRERYSYLNSDFKIFIIGGKNIYEQFIPLCQKIWVTRIKQDYLCDLFLNYDFSNEFEEKKIDEDDELIIYEYNKCPKM